MCRSLGVTPPYWGAPCRYADELQRWRLCLGKHNLTMEEPSQKCFGVLAIHRHEGFRYPQVPTVEFDIALLQLDGEVVPSDEIIYACLPPLENVLPKDKKCYATGWGDETGQALFWRPLQKIKFTH